MTAAAAAGAVAPPAERGAVPPAERGAVTVADRAVRRIAGRAAGEAVGPGGSARAASAHVRGGRARVAVEVTLPFPVDAASVTARVQRHVIDRTRELTGLTVSRADVLVDRLEPASGSRPQPRTTSLPAVGARPVDLAKPGAPTGPGPRSAEGGSGGARRRGGVRRRPWSPRGAPSALVASVAAPACVLGLHLAAVAAFGAPASPVSDLAGRFADRVADAGVPDAAVLVGALVLAVLGLWMLLLALTPGARRRLRLASPDEEVRAVLDRSSVVLLLRDTAVEVPGVATARVRVGRRRARLRATVAFGNLAETRAALTGALTIRRDALGLTRPPRLRLRVTPSPLWRTPHGDGNGDGSGGRKPADGGDAPHGRRDVDHGREGSP